MYRPLPRSLKRQPRPQNSDDRILPLVNVVFLLLIFFMIAGQLAEPAPFRVTPPVADLGAGSAPTEHTIYLGAGGELALDGEPLSIAELAGKVRDAARDTPERPLRLKADGAVSSAEVLRLLSALREAGVTEVRLVARGGDGS